MCTGSRNTRLHHLAGWGCNNRVIIEAVAPCGQQEARGAYEEVKKALKTLE